MMPEEFQAFNAITVDLIEGGEYGEAVKILLDAVSRFSKQIPPHPATSALSKALQTQDNVTIHAQDVSGMDPSAAKGDFFFHPFSFECVTLHDSEAGSDDEDGGENEPQLSRQDHLSCLIPSLYNIGLCLHLEWAKRVQDQTRNASDKFLERALYFYSQAFALTAECPVLRPDDPIMTTLLAICTNAAHCHAHLSDLHHLRFWNTRLQQVLEYSYRGFQEDHPGWYYLQYFQLCTALNNLSGVAASAA